jgi:DNA polymerase elongation subunit (family B)
MLTEDEFIDLTNIDEKEIRNIFGPGYRYCCYKTTGRRFGGHGTQPSNGQGVILFLGYDKQGNPQNYKIPHKSHVKYVVKYKTQEKDIFGRYVETKYFNNTTDRKNFIDNFPDKANIIECLPPQNEFLHKYFDEYALDESFNTFPLRIQYYDIETEISDDGFEEASTARQRINMITIYDNKTEKFYTWSLEHIEPDFSDEYDENGNLINSCCLKDAPLDKFVIYEFSDDEARMLRHFHDWFIRNRPDVFMGFNSQAFDLGYIMNRMERVLGNPDRVVDKEGHSRDRWCKWVKDLSPVGKVRERHNNTDNERANKQAEYLYEIDGIFNADLLILYRDKYKIKQPLDGGNGLDNIGEVECGINKIHYKGTKAPNGETIHSLKDLYLKDWNRFYKYNVMDVEVLRRVEEKVKTIPLSRTITSSGLSNYDAIYSSIGYLIGSLIMFAKTQMGIVFTSYKGVEKESIPFEGAFVFPPIPGLYRGGIMTVDFSSLYPSSIRAGNFSPETYVGKISRFPIEDPTMEFFTKEPPIDLNGIDIIGKDRRTNNEVDYDERFKHKYENIDDTKIEKFYLLPANGGKQKVITRKQLDELLETKCIFTRNNTLFLKHSVKQGVVSSWSTHFYNLRKKTRKTMEKLDDDIFKGLIEKNKIKEAKEKIQNLNDKQQAIKIMINSIYGILSTSFSPVYNPYISQSITRLGKFLNISSSEFIKMWLKDNYGIKDDYIVTVSGDTDSAVSPTTLRIRKLQ